MEVNGQLHASAALPLGKEALVFTGCCGEEKRFLPLSGIESQLLSRKWNHRNSSVRLYNFIEDNIYLFV
jgi:hypothetical protein